jgi:hypothetical protein
MEPEMVMQTKEIHQTKLLKLKHRIQKIAPALILIGLLLGLYSSTIPFKDWFSKTWENRIFLRGMLLGFLLVSIGSAAIVKNLYLQNGIIALGVGIFSLLFISTLNLLIDNPDDDFIKTEYYFSITFWVIGILFAILTILRLWLIKLLRFLNFLSSLV